MRDDTAGLPVQPISGPFQVRLDGTVGLGFWGSVPVAGLTLDQAAEAIRSHLLQHETLKQFGTAAESVIVIVDVLAYNSKRYYVITDGGGFGEQVFPFPITGSETVLDAMGNINGLPDVASKRNIWVARRTPAPRPAVADSAGRLGRHHAARDHVHELSGDARRPDLREGAAACDHRPHAGTHLLARSSGLRHLRCSERTPRNQILAVASDSAAATSDFCRVGRVFETYHTVPEIEEVGLAKP